MSLARPHTLRAVPAPRPFAAALLTIGLAACATSSSPAPPAPADPEPVEPVPPLARRAAAALADGDWTGAHAALTELVAGQLVDEARAALADGRPADALLVLDEVWDLTAENADAELCFADAAYALGEEGLGADWFEDARRAYGRADAGLRSELGAGRSAFMLFRFDEALEHAFAARALAREGAGATEELPERPLALLARAGTFAQAAARDAGEEERADAIVERVAQELGAAAADDPLDPWIPSAIGTLYERAGRLEIARSNVRRALDRMPTEAALHQRLAEIAYAADDDLATAIETFEAVTATHPEVALGHWYLARARFDAALIELERDPDAADDPESTAAADSGGEDASPGDGGERAAADPAERLARAADGFRAAERSFVRCAELDAETASACEGWRALCRNGVAWCHYNAGDLAAAERAFLSTNDVLERGVEWQLPGRLLDGIVGLELIVGAHNEAGDFARAAATSERLRELQPDEVKWANNAGFFHRDAGVAREDRARRLRSAAAHLRGEELPVDPTDPQAIGRPALTWNDAALAELRAECGFTSPPALDVEVSAYRTLASQHEEAARAHFEKSYAAYRKAAELAPTDVRIVNDTALVAVYHLGRDLGRAEVMLRRCVRLGAEQTEGQAVPTIDDEHFDLWNAWGDAHQNLGVLELRHHDDPAAAIPWFERSIEIGPIPRPVSAILIERCQELAPESASNR